MLEGMSKRMGEAGARVSSADAEALWADIQRMAAGIPWTDQEDPFIMHNFMLAKTIVQLAEHEHWTMLHTALALAYAHMVLSQDHWKDLTEMQALSIRPMVVHQHCEGCTCKDKITRWE
jgi:hypothetical protein